MPTNQPIEITPDSNIRLHFSLATPDGTEAVTTFGEEPANLTMGNGDLSEGLELALYGLKKGDRQTLTLSPEQAFGLRDEAKIHEMPLGDFPPEMELEPGLVIGFSTPTGKELAGIILDVGEEKITIDFNHPLAGEAVVFKVEIVEVTGPSETHSHDN